MIDTVVKLLVVEALSFGAVKRHFHGYFRIARDMNIRDGLNVSIQQLKARMFLKNLVAQVKVAITLPHQNQDCGCRAALKWAFRGKFHSRVLANPRISISR